MRLPASVLGVLKLGVMTAIALPGCDVIGEAQSAPAASAEAAAEAPIEQTPVEQTRVAEPAPREQIVVAEASPGGLGREVTSALERARIAAPIERAPLVEDPTVIVPFSEDPSRVEPIRARAREKTPKPIARPRVRPRPDPVAVAPVIAVPKNWDSCPACGRG